MVAPLNFSTFQPHPAIADRLRVVRRRFAPSNFMRVGGVFFGGFPRTAKKLEKSSRNPLRRRGRFGILLTRCAEQGESRAARQEIFDSEGASRTRSRGSHRGAFGRDAEHKNMESLL